MGAWGFGGLAVIGYYVCQCGALSPQLAGLPHGRVTPLKRLTAERRARGAVWLLVPGGFPRWFAARL